MAENDEFFEDQGSESLDPNIRAELRKSKERAREVESARAEAEALRRELAFTKAGIPDEGVGALLRKAYDGDTDPEAIRKAAEEYGVFPTSTHTPQADPVIEELERHRNIAGATGTNASGPSPQQEFLAALAGAANENEARAVLDQFGTELGLHLPTT